MLNDRTYVTNLIKSLNLNENDPDRLNALANKCECSYCAKKNFIGYRYQCLICKNYNLCCDCFDNKRENGEHRLGHLMVRYDEPDRLFGQRAPPSEQVTLKYFENNFSDKTHDDIKCCLCEKEPIVGLRIECLTCAEYDLCLKCYKKNDEDHPHDPNKHQIILVSKDDCQIVDVKQIRIIKPIGRGAFGAVHEAVYMNKRVAYKVIQPSKNTSDSFRMDPNQLARSFLREKHAYQRIKSDFILKMIGTCVVQTTDKIEFVILTEFMANGSLASFLKKNPNFPFLKRLDMAVNIASGMSKIHDMRFIHRDIRPDNILVDENFTAKIGDMGLAKECDPRNYVSSNIGCESYMPSEFYQGNYDQKLDVFTYGLTLNELYDGLHSMKYGNLKLKIKSPVFFRYFIDGCLSEPHKRPPAKDLENVFKSFQKVMNKMIDILVKDYNEISHLEKNKTFVKIHDLATDIFVKNNFQFPSN